MVFTTFKDCLYAAFETRPTFVQLSDFLSPW